RHPTAARVLRLGWPASRSLLKAKQPRSPSAQRFLSMHAAVHNTFNLNAISSHAPRCGSSEPKQPPMARRRHGSVTARSPWYLSLVAVNLTMRSRRLATRAFVNHTYNRVTLLPHQPRHPIATQKERRVRGLS